METSPILVLDEEHYCYERPDGSQGQQFAIEPAARLIMQLGTYRFDVPPEWGWIQPDTQSSRPCFSHGHCHLFLADTQEQQGKRS